MNLLTPLGLLGLLGLVALLIIYLLKPNYQHKAISSTYIWKLSLKYRRKRLPISKFRHILLLICQILIITLCAFMLAQPFHPSPADSLKAEKVFVLDASASMLTQKEGETRFERAVTEIKKDAAAALSSENGTVSVILAGKEAEYLSRREKSDGLDMVNAQLDGLIDGELKCTYGEADTEGAMKLAEEVLLVNPDAEVIFYTDNTYIDSGNVTVKNVFDKGVEWNASIGNVDAYVSSGYYIFRMDVGCYGRHERLTLNLDIYGVNSERRTVSVSYSVLFTGQESQKLILRTRPAVNEDGSPFDDEDPIEEGAVYLEYSDSAIYSYDYVHAYFTGADDSFKQDNSFYLYDGRKETIRVQYFSTKSNPFVSGVIMGQRDVLKKKWDIDFVQVQSGEPELKGFDFYIFENTMPLVMPIDGIVMLINPDMEPYGSGLSIGAPVKGDFTVSKGSAHAITEHMPCKNLGVSEYVSLTEDPKESGYEELLYCNGEPVLLAKNDVNQKVIAMLFSVNTSYEAVFVDFPILFGNLFEYFLPTAVSQPVFNVGDAARLRARGSSMNVTSTDMNETLVAFPASLELEIPGVYTLTQPIMADEATALKFSVNNFFVRVPQSENNVYARFEKLEPLKGTRQSDPVPTDLVFYFAIALLLLVVSEWYLHTREF